ncbi:FxsC C-terminal domain [Frankia sp. AiPs1]|uniref:TIR-like protein FxsC n=1 Tax=Frankia sp. AiPa1 TaxID=573492 RepID=UPI00202B8A6E|nr:TIR-like protein FxsC [Frankia sp. AiPa1]MCL9758221.1 TIR-like protein FxsC [Frankia sp. AiPa1]
MRRDADTADPMAGAPLYFFLSYARLDGQDDNYLHRFVNDLRREVRARSGHPSVEGVGFLDTTNIQPGEAWSEELSDALHRCHTFVAICSPSFFASEYCGKEWQAFSDRCQDGYLPDGGRSPSLLPVIWTPLPDLPPALARLQYDHVGFGELYARRGLRYLLQLRGNHDEYQEFLVSLAERIVHLVRRSPLPPRSETPDFHRIRSAFEPADFKDDQTDLPTTRPAPGAQVPSHEVGQLSSQPNSPGRKSAIRSQPADMPQSAVDSANTPRPTDGDGKPREPGPTATAAPPPQNASWATAAQPNSGGPQRVTFVMAVASAVELSSLRNQLEYYGGRYDEWTPYHPRSRQRVCIAAQTVAARQDMSSNIVALHDGIGALLEASRDRNEIVIFIVDAWSTQLEPFHNALREYDKRNEPTTGVLIPWNLDDPETIQNSILLKHSLQRALRNNHVRQDNLRAEIHTHEEFDASLFQMLIDTQARIFRSSSSARRPDSPPRRRPFLDGP